jgi:hypothetical protein
LAVEPVQWNPCNFQALGQDEASDMPETAQYRIDVTKWCNHVIFKGQGELKIRKPSKTLCKWDKWKN